MGSDLWGRVRATVAPGGRRRKRRPAISRPAPEPQRGTGLEFFQLRVLDATMSCSTAPSRHTGRGVLDVNHTTRDRGARRRRAGEHPVASAQRRPRCPVAARPDRTRHRRFNGTAACALVARRCAARRAPTDSGRAPSRLLERRPDIAARAAVSPRRSANRGGVGRVFSVRDTRRQRRHGVPRVQDALVAERFWSVGPAIALTCSTGARGGGERRGDRRVRRDRGRLSADGAGAMQEVEDNLARSGCWPKKRCASRRLLRGDAGARHRGEPISRWNGQLPARRHPAEVLLTNQRAAPIWRRAGFASAVQLVRALGGGYMVACRISRARDSRRGRRSAVVGVRQVPPSYRILVDHDRIRIPQQPLTDGYRTAPRRNRTLKPEPVAPAATQMKKWWDRNRR